MAGNEPFRLDAILRRQRYHEFRFAAHRQPQFVGDRSAKIVDRAAFR
jgi:hypothetical protein